MHPAASCGRGPSRSTTTPGRLPGTRQTRKYDGMLIPIVCPSCGHIGAVSGASLPRELCCSSCGSRHRFERAKAAEERALHRWRPQYGDDDEGLMPMA